MTLVHYTARVTSERLLELPLDVQEELHLEPGQEIQIHFDQANIVKSVTVPNERGLAALRLIAQRQEGRRHTDGSQTEEIIREGRTGAMYGIEPTG